MQGRWWRSGRRFAVQRVHRDPGAPGPSAWLAGCLDGHESGFTIIEVAVAGALLALLLTAVVTATLGMQRLGQATIRRTSQLAGMQRAAEVLNQEVALADGWELPSATSLRLRRDGRPIDFELDAGRLLAQDSAGERVLISGLITTAGASRFEAGAGSVQYTLVAADGWQTTLRGGQAPLRWGGGP